MSDHNTIHGDNTDGRMVASVKQCLKKTLGNARMSFDELSTVLTEVESTLNSRPLTYEYSEVDEEVLTPSHLIYGRRIKTLPDEIVEPDDALNHGSSSARFKYLSTKLAHFDIGLFGSLSFPPNL